MPEDSLEQEQEQTEKTYKTYSSEIKGGRIEELFHRVEKQAEQILKQEKLLFLGFLILLIMTATLLVNVVSLIIDNHQFKASNYQQLIYEVRNQNIRIEELADKQNTDFRSMEQELGNMIQFLQNKQESTSTQP